MKVAFLTSYPVQNLESAITIARQSDNFHPTSWVTALLSSLSEKLEVHVVTETPYVSHNEIVKKENVTFHILKSGFPMIHRGYPYWFPLEPITMFSLNSKRILAELETINPDILHCFGTEWTYSIAGLRSRYPCLVHIQGIMNQYVKFKSNIQFRIVAALERQQIKKATHFICKTDYDSTFVRSLNPLARIFRISEAVNPIFFSLGEKRYEDCSGLLFVGYVSREKGIDALIKSISLLNRRIPNIKVHIVGKTDPHFYGHLKNELRLAGMEQNVSWLGFKMVSEIAQYHRQARLFVYPTRNDNSPNAVAEAMVSGTPVIASAVGGLPSMIENDISGVLVPPDDPILLADKIVQLYGDKDKWTYISENAIRIARARYLPSNVADVTLEAYKRTIHETRNARCPL